MILLLQCNLLSPFYTHRHKHQFSGRFPCRPSLAGCTLGFLALLVPKLHICSGCTGTYRVLCNIIILACFCLSPSTSMSSSQYYLLLGFPNQQITKLTGSIHSDALISTLSFRVDPHIHLIMLISVLPTFSFSFKFTSTFASFTLDIRAGCHFIFSRPIPFRLPILPRISSSTRPDSSKDLGAI